MKKLVHPPKTQPGDRVAVVSPGFAAPAVGEAVHEQAIRRLWEATGLIPVEYPTSRQLGASALDRAADLNAAFADPSIRAILATIGGSDQITVTPHLDPDLARADPKPFLGTSDNTNIHTWLWTHGLASFYGGSTQVHLGPGPSIDACHLASLRAALITGETLEITEPGHSEDVGKDWHDPAALTTFGDREPTEPWSWAGPERKVTGRTWGGCLEVLDWLLTADRLPHEPEALDGAVLILEASEQLTPATQISRIVRSLGEQGLLAAAAAVILARSPASDLEHRPDVDSRAAHRREQREAVIAQVMRYNPDAVICVGPPFGHTRPQWILPHGGAVTVDNIEQRIWADYS